MKFYTVGAFHHTAEEFFKKLTSNNIDTFCDIRQKRGVRGAEYAFVNSNRLQDKLRDLGIHYEHITGLAPDDGIRKVQIEIDEEQGVKYRDRQELDKAFIDLYESRILNHFDFYQFISDLDELGAKKVVLFCVEQNPRACHRSIVASELSKMGYDINHLL